MDGQLRTIDEIHHASERVTELAAELEGSLTIFRTGADGHRAPSVSDNTTATRWPDEEIAVRPRREAAPRREPAARAEAPPAKITRAPKSEPARSPEDRF